MGYGVASISKQIGFGATVISKLIKMGLKKNLYYEIKDVIAEERQDGVHSYKHKVRTKVYGLTSTKAVRQLLIDLLIDRVENHKDKFISPIIYNELLGMEIKRNGKVEHSASTHDDQIFSLLLALYMWYEGVNMAERFGLKKVSIKTDDEVDEQLDYYNDETMEIVDSFNKEDEFQEDIEKDLNAAIKAGGIQMEEFINKRREEERAVMESVLNTPIGAKAFKQQYGIPQDMPIEHYVDSSSSNGNTIPDSVFINFYNQNISNSMYADYEHLRNITTVPEGQISLLEDDDYKYTDHFNF